MPGTCSSCGAGSVPVIDFALTTETHVGEAGKLCVRCLLDDNGHSVDLDLRPLVEGKPSRRKALRRGKKTSQKQEVEVAEEFGGRTQPNSGAMAGAKGDVRKKGELRIEAKYTAAGSYSLKLEELEKIAGE